MIYNRPITTAMNHLSHIDKAYDLAGVARPTRAVAVESLVRDEPTAAQVTAKVAAEAFHATNPETFYQEALERIQRAHAGDSLRAGFSEALKAATRANIRDIVTQAATDLAPAFEKLTKQLTEAAKELHPTKPLDVESAVEMDTTTHYKTARTILAKLGTYAGVYAGIEPQDMPGPLVKLLPIINITGCKIQKVEQSLGRKVVNSAALTETLAVRQLAKDATDPDTALLRVAAGKYAGVTLALGTPEQMKERIAQVRVAYSSEVVGDTSNNMVSFN